LVHWSLNPTSPSRPFNLSGLVSSLTSIRPTSGAHFFQLDLVMKKGFLIDMDGVIYRSAQLIPGAVEFIRLLDRWDIPFLFLTNNSQRTRRDVATKLQRMGIPVDERHIFTCAMATARFLARQKPSGTAYVIGEGGLLTALHTNGYSIVDKSPDYVVVGEGRTLSFEMLEHAVQMVIDGAKLIATNLDPNCPTQVGTRPGCGAIVSLIEAATGIKAFSVGKPSPVMMRTARKELGMATSETIMIGDTMETDIVGGVQMGYRTILVLTGGTKREDLGKYAYLPDMIVNSIADLCDPDKFLHELLPTMNREDDTPQDMHEWIAAHS
jgi:NagD protein